MVLICEQEIQIISKPSAGSHPTACSSAYGHPQGSNRSLVALTLTGALTQGSVTKGNGVAGESEV